MVLLALILTQCVLPHLRIVFCASELFEDESLPWVASEPSNVGAYKNHYSAVENLHFPPYLLVGTWLL